MRLPWTRRHSYLVVVYGKPGCHLCDDALALLTTLRRRYPHELEQVDIRSDPNLFRRYDIRIPVLTIDGGPEIDGPITAEKLRAAFEGATRRPDAPPSKYSRSD